MTCAAVPSVLQNGVVVYQNVKNAHELERILVATPVEVGAEHERMYVGVMLQRDPQNQRLYLHDVVTEKEFTTGGNGHLNTTGPNAANGELYTADILRNALNVKSEQHSAGRSIEEMTGEDLSNVGHMKEEAFPKLTALPETPALCGGMLLRTVYPPAAGMSTAIICRPARRRSWQSLNRVILSMRSWVRIRGSGARRTSSPYREAIDSFGGVDDVTLAAQHT